MAGLESDLVDTRARQDALGLVAADVQPSVHRALERFNVRLEMNEAPDFVVARIESGCPPLLLIDTELMGCLTKLCCFARSLRPDVTVFGLTYFWSERDESMRECADAILHKPPRQPEWDAVMRRFGVPELTSPIVSAGRVA